MAGAFQLPIGCLHFSAFPKTSTEAAVTQIQLKIKKRGETDRGFHRPHISPVSHIFIISPPSMTKLGEFLDKLSKISAPVQSFVRCFESANVYREGLIGMYPGRVIRNR